METIKVKTIYCDMDGVLANFKGHYQELFGKNPDTTPDPELWNDINTHGKAKFFEELPWMPGGQELWKFMTDNFMRVKILTALGKTDKVDKQGSRGKRAWLAHHIPNLMDKDIKMVINKHQKQWYSRPGDIIIDDTPLVIDEWNAKGGTGILYQNANQAITELKKHLYEED